MFLGSLLGDFAVRMTRGTASQIGSSPAKPGGPCFHGQAGSLPSCPSTLITSFKGVSALCSPNSCPATAGEFVKSVAQHGMVEETVALVFTPD